MSITPTEIIFRITSRDYNSIATFISVYKNAADYEPLVHLERVRFVYT